MPQSLRRKSCQACARSKRRCDLNIPRCRRCKNTGRECLYPGLSPVNETGQGQGQGQNHSQGTSTDLAVFFPPPAPSTEYGTEFDTAAESLWTTAGLDDHAFNPVQTVPRPMSPVMLSLLQDIVSQPGIPPQPVATWDMDLFETVGTAPPLELMSVSPSSTLVSPIAPPPKPAVGRSVFIARTEYAARRMASQAAALAMDGRTTFIHHTQISTSAALREALAASALHAVRNPANVFIVRAEVSRRAKALIDAVETARAHVPSTEMDMLHPVQALLIYQCIRLFSTSDIVEQAQAERHGAHMRVWVNRLREQLPPLIHGPLELQSWESWIWCESIRRTVVFAELLGGIYSFLKYGWDDAHGRMDRLEYSVQTALWEANTAAEWRAAQTTRSPLHVTLATFNTDTGKARPCDVDDLAISIRAINLGLENLEEWLTGDETAVQRWGLKSDANRLPAY